MAMETTTYETEYDEQAIKEYKAALKKYWLTCFFMEGSKILLFLIIFSCLNMTKPFLFALLILMLVRCNGGGLHCEHYWSCFFLSFTVLVSCIFCGTFIYMPKYIAIIILLISSIIGYQLVPIVSKNRPEPDKNQITKSKLRTVISILLYCFLICISPYNQYINIGTWTIIIHILQLILAKIIQGRNEDNAV